MRNLVQVVAYVLIFQLKKRVDKMPIMEISIVPLGTETSSVSGYVASALKILEKEEGIKFELTSMGTIIEADSLKKLLNIAYKMHQAVFKEGVRRVVTSIKIDERKDKRISMNGKIEAVRSKLGRNNERNK